MTRAVPFLLLLIATVVSAEPRTTIDPQEHREQIRVQLLKMTPRGSTTAAVREFITRDLKQKAPALENHPAMCEAAQASPNKGVACMRIVFGKYLANPVLLTLSPPMPIEREVDVEWAFDKDGRLLDIFVDKHAD